MVRTEFIICLQELTNKFDYSIGYGWKFLEEHFKLYYTFLKNSFVKETVCNMEQIINNMPKLVTSVSFD